MASSSVIGKSWLRSQIVSLSPISIVDVGPGRGTYWDLLSSEIEAYWMAIEVWAPYVSKYGLSDKYNEVIIADVRWLDWDKVGLIDLVIFGDVLEHMTKSDALVTWNLSRKYAGRVALSLPIIEWPQGSWSGNPFEKHISTWTHEDCMALPGVYSYRKSTKIGAYLAHGEYP